MIFLSHADNDKKIARKLADELSRFALKIFVAHDDIQVGDHWEITLVEKIRNCDLFMVLLSEHFHEARYTDHEVGIAYNLNKPIVPVRVDETMPYGFMSKFQARKISANIDKNEITNLFCTMSEKGKIGMKMRNNLIDEFCESGSFISANTVSSFSPNVPIFQMIRLVRS